MNKLSTSKKVDAGFTIFYFAIFVTVTVITIIAYLEDPSKLPYYATFCLIFLLIAIDSLISTLKFKHHLICQLIVEVIILADVITCLCLSEPQLFDKIFDSAILIIFSMNITLKIVSLSLQRVQNKVEFQPMKPIIKP